MSTTVLHLSHKYCPPHTLPFLLGTQSMPPDQTGLLAKDECWDCN